MTTTLTQVLFENEQVLLFGDHVSDFYLRGDLGLGLDPAGPVGFAWIRSYQTAEGQRQRFATPLLVSVNGPGEPPTHPEQPGERCWQVDRNDQAVRMIPSRIAWADWLAPSRLQSP